MWTHPFLADIICEQPLMLLGCQNCVTRFLIGVLNNCDKGRYRGFTGVLQGSYMDVTGILQ